jgi:Zn-dependent alcohol dehydrogenase
MPKLALLTANGGPIELADRVVTPYFWTCGQCPACARGRSYAFAAAGAGLMPRGALVPE